MVMSLLVTGTGILCYCGIIALHSYKVWLVRRSNNTIKLHIWLSFVVWLLCCTLCMVFAPVLLIVMLCAVVQDIYQMLQRNRNMPSHSRRKDDEHYKGHSE